MLLLFELLFLCRSVCKALTLNMPCLWVVFCPVVEFESQRWARCCQWSPFSSPPSPQRRGWQMFGWLARHNKCIAGCLRWLLLAVLWVLHCQHRTGHFLRLFVKAGKIRNWGQQRCGWLILLLLLFFYSFTFAYTLIWCMLQVGCLPGSVLWSRLLYLYRHQHQMSGGKKDYKNNFNPICFCKFTSTAQQNPA